MTRMTKKLPNSTGLDLFWEMISIKRPYESEAEVNFLNTYLPGMAKDAFGNRFLVIGQRPEVAFMCHTDTVHRDGGIQKVYFDATKQHVFVDPKDPTTNCLGADDTTGIWLCLEMIKAGVPGLYIFHRGEEVGCVGANHLVNHEPEIVAGIQLAVSLDRRGTQDVITHQMGSRCASDLCGNIFASELNKRYKHFRYQNCDGGAFTDSEVYQGIIPECFNLSVGYYGQHGPGEYQDLRHMIQLRKALINVDWQRVLAHVTRDPAPKAWKRFSGAEVVSSDMSYQGLYDYVVENPDVIVEALMDMGINESDLWEYEYDVKQYFDERYEVM